MRKSRIAAGLLCWAWLLCAGAVLADAMPPLATAVSKGDLAAVKLLLDQGADPDTVWNGYTVLTWASGAGKLAIVKALVEHHASINPKGSWAPLAAAASNKQPEIAAYLIAHGALVNVQSSSGWTPLDDAEGNHDAKTAKVLRDHGGTSGLPPLLGAVNRGEVAKALQLLASGADPDSHDANNSTAVSIAANTGYLAIVKALVERHANVNTPDGGGWTPLMEATQNGHKDVAAYLIVHGADLNARNSDGQTALDVAVQTKHQDVIALLRASGAGSGSQAAGAPAFSDADCADFRRFADQGASSDYGSLAAGPAESGSLEETLGLRDANVSLGGSGCNVSDDGKTLICYWSRENKNYQGIGDYDNVVAVAKGCSGDSKVVSGDGKTTIWYARVPGKTLLVTIRGTDTDMTVTFGAAQPL